MEADETLTPASSWKQNKAAVAVDSTSGHLAAAAAKLAGRSRAIPSSRDFHFYNNFPDFKAPIREIAAKSEASLSSLAASSSSTFFLGNGKNKQPPPFPDDLDDAHDWLVSINDDLIERFGASMDEFKAMREKEEETGRKAPAAMDEGGFQVVYGKKKRGSGDDNEREAGVKVATKDKKANAARSKVPFHIPTIPRPQDLYSILVNNTNLPFEHVWLDRTDDGCRILHPLEKLQVEQFIDRNIADSEPVKPPALEDTPFKLVEDVKGLKELVSKLKSATEFAVDLEHNHYRSFQGLTCLMQISTRSEDFVVDTLKLRIHLGAYLRELFKDPTKRKVMHGADRDILWLQRDFGIYVCNLFDTGQASRVLQMDRNSLEYLLHHFCGVDANKEYQSADWRLRPLPDEMIKYAREDTHYLLHIYDLMKLRLLSESTDENDLLLEVYKRSNEICLQLYEKELLTDTSYLYLYGLREAEFSSNQLAVVAGLYQWRDSVARAEDESTGYILPNKVLIEIAREMPLTAGKLRRVVKSKHPFVERYLGSVISIIRSSIANSAAFESIAEQLKKGRLEVPSVETMETTGEDSEMIPSVDADSESNIDRSAESAVAPVASANIGGTSAASGNFTSEVSLISNIQIEDKPEVISLPETKSSVTLSGPTETMDEMMSNGSQRPAVKATVQILRRPTAFGALLGNSTSGRKSNLFRGFTSEQVESKNKVEKIKSSVALPFHHFSGGEKPLTTSCEMEIVPPEPESICHGPDDPSASTPMEEVIQLENEIDDPQSSTETTATNLDDTSHRKWFPQLPGSDNENGGSCHEPEDMEMPGSPSELACGFEKCFQSLNQRRNSQPNRKAHQQPEFNFQLKPFDYVAARKNLKFGQIEHETSKDDETKTLKDSGDRRKSVVFSQPRGGERESSSQNPRRRQAFPPSGNRSTSYH